MITLNPGSLCDVCADEYGPHNYPHSIPCGHILCLHCCNNIIDKTSSRLAPSCPFCRVTFTADTVRLIRVDFGSSSGWTTPRGPTPRGALIEDQDPLGDVGQDDDVLLLNPGFLKTRAEARRLEHKVAKVAAKKCSVEEVSTLHKELQEWLTSDVKSEDQMSSLHLSAALLRAILVNHLAHSEATKLAKSVEAHLKQRLEVAESSKSQLEEELRKLKNQYSHKMQECQSLRTELNAIRLKSVASSVPSGAPQPASAVPSALTTPPRPQSTSSISPARPGATSPTSTIRSTSYAPSMMSPLGRGTTPAPYQRSPSAHIPSHRPITPAVRSGTPAAPATDSSRTAPSMRSRTLSMSSPTKMIRTGSGSSSSSDEKEKERLKEQDKQREKDARRVQLIQRWIPSINSGAHGQFTGKPDSLQSHIPIPSVIPPSRTMTPAHAPPLRYKTPLSVQSP